MKGKTKDQGPKTKDLAALDSALWGLDWDLGAAQQRLDGLRACAPSDLMHSHHLIGAITGLESARTWLRVAERAAARLARKGASK